MGRTRKPVTTREHLAKHDRQIAAIQKLMLTGMKMLNRNQEMARRIEEQQRRTDEQLNKLSKEVRELTAAQKRTDAALRDFIERTGVRNGHAKRKVDLQ